MHIDQAQIGQIVTADGYGGFAKIINIEEADLPNQYRATVKFGINNPTTGRCKYTDIYEFPLGKLTPINKQPNKPEPETAEEILAALAEIDAKLKALTNA